MVVPTMRCRAWAGQYGGLGRISRFQNFGGGWGILRGFHGPKLTFVVGVEPLKHAQVPPEACLGTPEAHPGAPPTHDFEIWERVKSAWRRKLGMVPRGLEPRTLRLLAVRSNQLSYETVQRCARLRANDLAEPRRRDARIVWATLPTASPLGLMDKASDL